MRKKLLIIIIVCFLITILSIIIINPFDLHNNSNNEIECSGGFIIFDYPPVDLDKIEFILPLGGMHGDHITPTDHQYYYNNSLTRVNDSSPSINAYSPADGIITRISHKGETDPDGSEVHEDYRIIIQHTCTIYSIYIHLTNLSDRLMAYSPDIDEHAFPNVEVNAGEVIGRFWQKVDYNVVDMDVNLDFVVPEHYESEFQKLHVSDPFDYFNNEIKNKMISKSVRTVEPIGGQICYDIKGKLVGNWFLENTNYYAGLDRLSYYEGHLVFAYDWFDPSFIRISIGPDIELSGQWGVRYNSLDPMDISVESGIVKIELVSYTYIDGWEPWDALDFRQNITCVNNNDGEVGVLLCELIDDYTLKMEVFPEKKAEEVDGFTENALIFER